MDPKRLAVVRLVVLAVVAVAAIAAYTVLAALEVDAASTVGGLAGMLVAALAGGELAVRVSDRRGGSSQPPPAEEADRPSRETTQRVRKPTERGQRPAREADGRSPAQRRRDARREGGGHVE